MKQTFTAIILILAIYGCKKDNSISNIQAVINGTYISSHTAFVQAPVMYIQNRQITDSAIINNFLRQHNFMNRFTYAATQYYADSLLSISFNNIDSVTFKANFFSPNLVKAKRIDTADNEMIIRQYDSTIHYGPPTVHYRCDTLDELAIKHHIIFYVRRPQYMPYHVIYFSFPLVNQNNLLSLPLMTIAFSSRWNYSNSSGYCNGIDIDNWNIKAKNIENSLSSTDTLVIQEKRIPLTQ